jgi:hypothetical protein
VKAKLDPEKERARIDAIKSKICAVPLTPFGVIPKRKWVIPNLVMEGQVTIVTGKGGKGKSMLAVQVALAATNAAPCLLWKAPAAPLTVLLLNGEDDRHEQQRRLKGAGMVMGLEPNGRLLSIHEDQITLFKREFDPKSGEMTRVKTPLFLRIEELITEHQIKLLIVDPLIETNDGFDENANNDMKEIVVALRRLARATGVGILAVDHSRKGAVGGDQDDVRGASSKVNAARRAFTLSGMTKAEAKEAGVPEDRRPLYVRVGDAKANYSEQHGDRWLKLVPTKLYADEEDSDWVAPFEVAEDLAPVDDAFNFESWPHLDAFRKLVERGCEDPERPWGTSIRSSSARLDREMAARFKISEEHAQEIIGAAEARGLIMRADTKIGGHEREIWKLGSGIEVPF